MDLVSLSLAKKYTDEQISTLGTPADYVVEQGSNANENWRKWNSGVMECWGKKTVSATITSALGGTGFYVSERLTIIYPVVFYSIDESSISKVDGNNATIIYYDNTTVSQQYFYLVRSSSTPTSNYDVGYHATGRWKA